MKRILLALFIVLILSACSNDEPNEGNAEVDDIVEVENNVNENESEESGEIEEDLEEEINYDDLTHEEKILYNILELIDEGKAFDSGSYIPGDIPKGEYVFSMYEGSGEYYVEKELNGSIIDNENFASFGYVFVHGVGNIETRGVLISIDDLEEIGATGAKEIYEVLNSMSDYQDSGYYKVGVDIDPGEYVIESLGEGYVAVMSGPVGNSNIVNNENFNGVFAVSVQDGQYLKVSRGTITE